MQKISENKAPACEVCDGDTHRVYQPVGIIFKGSGFYKTDNRSDKTKHNSPAKPTETKEKTVPKKKEKDKKKVAKD